MIIIIIIMIVIAMIIIIIDVLSSHTMEVSSSSKSFNNALNKITNNKLIMRTRRKIHASLVKLYAVLVL